MRSPFKFLSAYTREDREQFFGRDEEIKTLYQIVFKTNLMLVYGLSVTGKTSLVQCGLANRFDDSEWYPFLIRRENNINDAIFKATKVALGEDQTEDIVENIRMINENYFRPVYLLFDQFEELFILGSKDEQVACIANIKAILDANLPCKIILIMREEYIGRLYNYEQTIPALFDQRYRVEPMSPLQVKEVISKSFEQFNVQLESPIDQSIQLIIDNLSDKNNEIALPYLQVYMDIVYRDEYQRTIGDKEFDGTFPLLPLTREEINSAGRIEDVLNKFLDQQEADVYNTFHEQFASLKREDVAAVLDAFVTDEGTKRPLSISRKEGIIELSKADKSRFPALGDSLLNDMFNRFEQARLLRISNDSVELAHDSLAALVEERRSEDQKVQNQIRKRLFNSLDEYEKTGTYLSRPQLESFSEFLPLIQLPPEMEEFIKNSEQEVERKEKQEIDNQRKQLEAEQEIKKAELVRQKLNAEKKARQRLGVGATIIGLLLPVIAFMWYTANERGKEIEIQKEEISVQKVKVDSLYALAKEKNFALSKINSELNYVKSILDTINQTGVSGDSLYLLVSQAVSSIDALKKDKAVEDVDDRKLAAVIRAFTTAKRGGTLKKETFKKGEVIYFYSYYHIPRKGEQISVRWVRPDGKQYHSKAKQMGYNWEDKGAEFWDAKGQLTQTGEYKIEILNGKKEVIYKLSFKVI